MVLMRPGARPALIRAMMSGAISCSSFIQALVEPGPVRNDLRLSEPPGESRAGEIAFNRLSNGHGTLTFFGAH